MKYALHIAITMIAVLLAAGHLAFPTAKIDAVTLALLVIAALPWLGSIFTKVEFPGGLKVEYKALEKARADAEKAGLLETQPTRKEEPIFAAIAEHDPNLALAGLRIEVERRLRAIADKNGIDARRSGIGQLMRSLLTAGALSQNEASVLNDMMGLLNEAVHGAKVDERAAEWAITVGSQLLASLDKRIS